MKFINLALVVLCLCALVECSIESTRNGARKCDLDEMWRRLDMVKLSEVRFMSRSMEAEQRCKSIAASLRDMWPELADGATDSQLLERLRDLLAKRRVASFGVRSISVALAECVGGLQQPRRVETNQWSATSNSTENGNEGERKSSPPTSDGEKLNAILRESLKKLGDEKAKLEAEQKNGTEEKCWRQLSRLNGIVAQIDGQLAELEQTNSQLEAQVAALVEQNRVLVAQVAQKEVQMEELKRKMSAISSMSALAA